MIQMVVFDMAGTTVDEDNVVYKTLRKAINEAGFDFSLEQVLTEGAGKEKLQAIKSVLSVYGGIGNDSQANEIFENFKVLLTTAYETLEIKEQPGASKTFAALKNRNIKVVLNTGYNRETALSLLKKLGWSVAEQIDGLVTASDVMRNRPNPDMILAAMQYFNISDSSTVIKIGDSIIDIEEGRNAGCAINIGITTGAHSRQQLESIQPEYIIDALSELIAIVDTIAND